MQNYQININLSTFECEWIKKINCRECFFNTKGHPLRGKNMQTLFLAIIFHLKIFREKYQEDKRTEISKSCVIDNSNHLDNFYASK